VYFGIAYGLYALAFFLPSIIAGFKKTFGVQLSLIEVGLITAIPYMFAAVAMFFWSRHADRMREHVWHVAIPLTLGGLAIPVALYLHRPIAVMIPVIIAAVGIFSALPVFWALPTRFPGRHGGRRRHRVDQLDGKPRWVRRAVRHRRPGGPDRKQQGRHVGGGADHAVLRRSGRRIAGRAASRFSRRDCRGWRPAGAERVVPSVPTHRLIGSYRGHRTMPIAITSEHQDLADSVRALVKRVAPPRFCTRHWKPRSPAHPRTGVPPPSRVCTACICPRPSAARVSACWRRRSPSPSSATAPSRVPTSRRRSPAALIAAHDPEAKVLASLAAGEAVAAFALESDLTASRQGDILVIRGEARSVPAAVQASVLVLPVDIESGIEWTVLDADSLEIVPLRSVDPLRPVAHVRANGVEIGLDRLLSKVSQAAGRAIATSLLSAEAVGIARWATDTASEYAKIREQFGRPIGQFQAIKHKCAEMIATTERATAAVWDAVRAIDEAAEQDWDNAATHYEFAAAVAATLAPAAAQRCTQDCIQVHGGIGFTWEHDTNVYYRHTLGLVAAFGQLERIPAAGIRHRRPPPACGHWTSTSIPTPRSCAARSVPKWLR
jgi:hypothetical protein